MDSGLLNICFLISAGVMFPPYRETEDGYESQMQINYLSHFYLTQLLLDKLKASGTVHSWSRIVNISSSMHMFGNPDLERFGKRYVIFSWLHYALNLSILVICSCFCSELLIFFKINFFQKKIRNTIRVSNGLGPDQDQRSVVPDLGPNCFQFG